MQLFFLIFVFFALGVNSSLASEISNFENRVSQRLCKNPRTDLLDLRQTWRLRADTTQSLTFDRSGLVDSLGNRAAYCVENNELRIALYNYRPGGNFLGFESKPQFTMNLLQVSAKFQIDKLDKKTFVLISLPSGNRIDFIQ